MTETASFYESENSKIRKNFDETYRRLQEINKESVELASLHPENNYYQYCSRLSAFILKTIEYERELSTGNSSGESLNDLHNINNSFFQDIFPENYKTSFANPAFMTEFFDDKTGPLLSHFYVMYRQNIRHAAKHRLYEFVEKNTIFIDFYSHIKKGGTDYDLLKPIVTRYAVEGDLEKRSRTALKERFDTDFTLYKDIILHSDLSDLRYLFQYGQYISKYELETAKFLNTYPDDKIKKIAVTVVDAYFDGFKRDNKEVGNRKHVELIIKIGQEQIYREIIKLFEQRGMDCLVSYCISTATNKQYFFDHKFDNALYLDAPHADEVVNTYKKAIDNCAGLLSSYSGIVSFSSFGEPPFTPENKPENLKLTEAQHHIFRDINSRTHQIYSDALPRSETNFCMISFPSPEIGEDFQELFHEMVTINTLDSDKYLKIQQKLIDILDTATSVHICGKDGNKTDITIQLQELKNPPTETLFENCGANINIPVGEVFTSPRLAGTTGTIHIGETFLRGLQYKNLTLVFTDGFVTDFSCTNYTSEEENRKYIKENLLFPHDTLPMGEFAIGTNTHAYAVSKKYDILSKLPALVIEKMGPHFAIGDTCYARSEDHKVFGPLDKKEIIARENEKSTVRNTSPEDAYTNAHTDITLPYEEISCITALGRNGKTDIIRDGRFVLKGTEELNEPLDE